MGGGVGPLAGVLLAHLPAVTTTCRGESLLLPGPRRQLKLDSPVGADLSRPQPIHRPQTLPYARQSYSGALTRVMAPVVPGLC